MVQFNNKKQFLLPKKLHENKTLFLQKVSKKRWFYRTCCCLSKGFGSLVAQMGMAEANSPNKSILMGLFHLNRSFAPAYSRVGIYNNLFLH